MTTATRPEPLVLRDRFGRIAHDLRVSLTDRCNLRCSYCMPAAGLEWLAHEDVLTDAEIIRLITLAVSRLGIKQVRFTGGEPLLRRGLEDIIAATTALRTIDDEPVETAITTNGLGLDKRADRLKAAGLGRVNISLDTINPTVYHKLSRRDRLSDVLAGIAAAQRAGLTPVKINTVIMPGINEADIIPLTKFCLSQGLSLRFIEQMPLGPRGTWERKDMITAQQIRTVLTNQFHLEKATNQPAHAPAENWRISGFINGQQVDGSIGIIASVTQPFCGNCDRTRLTADGAVRNCLFSHHEVSLRDLMRAGATDDELAHAWQAIMWKKKPGHGIDDPSFIQPNRTMSAIGG